ncbi:hypothetical protein ABIE77_001756 [Sinorhizobium fredii]
MGAEQAGERQCRRNLGAVDQRQAFLGGERHRGKPDRPQGSITLHAFAGDEGLAMPHHHGGHMGERCKVAGGADRALLRDQRNDALFEHPFDQANEFETDAGSAAPERDELQRHDQADDVIGQRLADPAAMREDQIALQGSDIGAVDLDRSEFAEAGVDAVDGRIARNDLGDARCGLLDAGIEGAVEAGRLAGPVDRFQVLERNRTGRQKNGHRAILSPLKTRSERGLKPMR